MIYKLQYWNKVDELPEVTSMDFKNLGLLMAYFQPHLPIELTENHWTLLVDMDVYSGGIMTENNGSFTAADSRMTRQEIDDLMAVNPAYINIGIAAIRNAFLKEIDKV